MQVKHIADGQIYAIKVLRKKDVKKRKQVGRTNTERLILAQASHVATRRCCHATCYRHSRNGSSYRPTAAE